MRFPAGPRSEGQDGLIARSDRTASATTTQRLAPLSRAAWAGSLRARLIRDGRSVFARQVLLALCEAEYGWSILARSRKKEMDMNLIEAYHGIESLPFEAGVH